MAEQHLASEGGEDALYLFCLARSGVDGGIDGAGIDGVSPLFAHAFQDIAAVLCRVGRGQFCGPEAEERLQDLAWVGPRACRHEQVIEQVMRRSPVLPVRLGTLFSSAGSLESLLRTHYDTVSRFLDRVAGQEEWGVTCRLDRARARGEALSAALSGQEAKWAAMAPGVRYLREQRLRLEIEKRLAARVGVACAAVVAQLLQHASECCRRPVRAGGDTAEGMEAVVKWSFLVPHASLEEFHAAVGQANAGHSGAGLEFETSGPWPPYSFLPALGLGPGA